ncbi:unnamed protein product [Symbiodinium natans]|uniref:Uncharacterized protein n=1 Tax=Symbiodinium natans TaxID=878477 RepID=A0A812Q912_9DINO|nr:unnamed protein product [Symbiodinium natans]
MLSILLPLLLAQGLAVRQLKSGDGLEHKDGEEGGCWNCCNTPKCSGSKFLDFGGVNVIFDECTALPGKWKYNEQVVKPEKTSAKFSLDAGSYICQEICKVLVGKDEEHGRRWETKTVYRTGGIEQPKCTYGYIFVHV